MPEAVTFQTKPALAMGMLERALDAGVPCRWVTGDTVYGGDRTLRFKFEQRRQAFVLAVACNEPLWCDGPVYWPAQELAARLLATAWQRLSAGAGTKGPRWYDRALQPVWRLQLTGAEQAWGHWLLVRRSVKKPGELAYYVVFAPRQGTTLKTLAQVASRRWAIEMDFEAAKQECGLDEYEARSWQAWHRHITLALLDHAFLVAMQWQPKNGGLSQP